MNAWVVFNLFFLALSFCLLSWEHEASELLQFLFFVVWSNNIQNQSDLLSLIFLNLSLICEFLSLLLKLLNYLVVNSFEA